MAARRDRVLRDKEINELLEDSEIEDVDDDEDPTYQEPEDVIHSHSEESDETSEDEDLGPPVSKRGRTRGNTARWPQAQRSRSQSNVRTRGGTPSRGRVRTRGGSRSASAGDRETDNTWGRISFSKEWPALLQPSYVPSEAKSSMIDYLEEYIDDDLFSLMVEKTNQTAIEKTGKSLNLTYKECKCFFAVTMLMACIGYPQIRMYWSEKYAVPIIVKTMTRDRYFLIRNSLKLVYDADITPEMRQQDMLWKVRPLLNRVIQGCYQQSRDQRISIDEMIIPFTGACPMRQYCPGKPNPTGLKAFILANPNGLVCDILVYQGKITLTGNEFSLGENVVLKLTETLVPGHVIYCDRYFTSIRLLDELNKRGFKAAGTIMKNRLPENIKNKLETDKDLSKRGRGSFDVLVRQDQQIAVTKWYDNKPVMLLSNIHAAETVDECRRYDRKIRRYVQVPRPEVVKEYNCNMGGVDLTDRLLAVCPSRMRTKKWTVRFMSHLFDLAFTNAWIKFKEDQIKQSVRLHKIPQLRAFKQAIAEKVIDDCLYPVTAESECQDNPPPAEDAGNSSIRGRPPIAQVPSSAFRQHGAAHLPAMGKKQHRCRQKGCDKKTTLWCTACNVPLCITTKRNCFADFHS